MSTAVVGLANSVPLFLLGAVVAGAASGIFTSPQQAAVADIIGSKARGGTAVATFQMMSDLGSIVGSLGVGEIAQHVSFGWAFGLSGLILVVAAVGWMFAPETRDSEPLSIARPPGRWARRRRRVADTVVPASERHLIVDAGLDRRVSLEAGQNTAARRCRWPAVLRACLAVV